ncbi:MAG: aldo/keto reductase [Candidatus Binatus sp.]|uniref:aldo/keto reductase n=1 Tax=Candidatus Binatus sp. TaxID=2811406 RepID=UPI00271FE5BC|nr:aldo/keto reductase [Candidatus Binatus sp.]MDO8433578.1 aldo/keto reductase [Candidatus Binatus sp.]
MQYDKLGKTGMTVSRICLGCMSYGDKKWRDWVLTMDDARDHFAAAIEAGINFYDTADVYSIGVSEEVTGRWLNEMGKRDELVVATKVNGPMGPGQNRAGLSRKHILAAVDASLRRLKMDYIDLYQIHRWDFATPIEETLEALDSIVRAGKVRYLGASSMAAWQFAKALHLQKENGWHRFISMQNHYNLVYREEEREMNPLCLDSGVGLIPWSPLARGFLAGNRDKAGSGPTVRAKSDEFAKGMYFRENDFEVLDVVESIAKERGVTPSQVACAWILQAPGVSAPIIGATKINHLKEAISAVDVKLSTDEVKALQMPYRPHPILGHTQPEPSRMVHGH